MTDLEIPVSDAMLMQVGNGRHDLADDICSLLFVE
jgi:hypothetical protein